MLTETKQSNTTDFSIKKWLLVLALGLILTSISLFVLTYISDLGKDTLRTFFITNIISFFITTITVIFPITYFSKKYTFNRQHILLLLFILSIVLGTITMFNDSFTSIAIGIPMIFIIAIIFHVIINFLLSKLPKITETISIIFIFLTFLSSLWLIYDNFINPRQEVFMNAMMSPYAAYSLDVIFERGEPKDKIIEILSSYGCTFENIDVRNYLYCYLPKSINQNDLINLEEKIKTNLEVYSLGKTPVLSY